MFRQLDLGQRYMGCFVWQPTVKEDHSTNKPNKIHKKCAKHQDIRICWVEMTTELSNLFILDGCDVFPAGWKQFLLLITVTADSLRMGFAIFIVWKRLCLMCTSLSGGRKETSGGAWPPKKRKTLHPPRWAHHPRKPQLGSEEWQIWLQRHVSECVAGLPTGGQQGALVWGQKFFLNRCK